MRFIYDDGGRENYYKGKNVGDCAVRAIAIALERDYKQVYDDLKKLNNGESCRNGTPKKVWKKYLTQNGWHTLSGVCEIGQDYKLHICDDDLKHYINKYDTMILNVSRHLTTIKNGALRDTYDSSRDGSRMIYQIWVK